MPVCHGKKPLKHWKRSTIVYNICMRSFLVFIFSVFFSVFAFCDLPVSFSGSTAVEWGINFNNGANGIKNSSEINIELPVISMDEKRIREGEKNYVEISIDDIQWVYRFTSIDENPPVENDFDRDDKGNEFSFGEVEAKAVFGNFYVNIFGNTEFSTNYAVRPFPFYDKNESFDDLDWRGARLVTGAAAGPVAGAFKAGYSDKNGVLKDFGIKFASTTNFENDSRNRVDSGYYGGFDFELTAGQKSSTGGSFQAGAFPGDYPWYGVGLFWDWNINPVTEFYAGFDCSFGSDCTPGLIERTFSNREYEVKSDAAMDMELRFINNFFVTSLYGVYISLPGQELGTAGEIKTSREDFFDIGFKVGLWDGNFVEPLDVSVAFVADQFLNNYKDRDSGFNGALEVTFSYKWFLNEINYFRPFLWTASSFTSGKTYVKGGLEYCILENASIYGYYESGELVDSDEYGEYVFSGLGKNTDDYGTLIFGLKVFF